MAEPGPPREPERDQDAHGQRVAAMFGRIAPFYDFLNHALSLGQDIRWRRALVRAVAPEGVVLKRGNLVMDLAAGTLDVSRGLARRYPGLRVAALDFALPMLARGASRKLKHGLAARVHPVQADGRHLPLPDQCLDGATIAFGIRNILPREDCWAEVLRCLKPGARFAVLEFGTGKKRVWRGLYNFYLSRLLPFIGKMVSKDPGAYRYLAETIKAFPHEEALAEEMRRAGFEDVTYRPMTSGIVFLHVGRKGIGKGTGE